MRRTDSRPTKSGSSARGSHLPRALRKVAGITVAALAFGALAGEASAERPGRRAWLGIELAPGPAGGVVAKHVVTNSPARTAGVSDGDQIVAADGVPLEKTEQLVARVAIAGPGGTVKLRVRRGGVEREISAMPIEHPGSEQVLRLDKVGTFAPTWKAVSVKGSVPANIGMLRGRVVLLDFWASWCGPCRAVAKDLSKLHTTYGAKGLSVVGLTSDSVEVANKAAADLAMLYPVASDADNDTAALYGVRALPTMFVIDKKGVIREIFIGYGPGHAEAVEKLITTLLAEPGPPPG
ncbi:TlpA disulfide reductase family protein [Polyangium aurulentum]|uniref:TlpA disulfide reductase family protein n=1 Tax=Polyangium aurulentum TaxID=2567896 RepID=UPI00146D1AC5|nr:TlpA disulfide reductase family protein [Polyangium aurulentum]UQA59257.1 redoxin domain-containing protein [Polyangium aurulentum]